ncbi:uncharacterized protein LOC108631187 [Ceratina calcarata]|uniref:Uncharacterized protein LOC108631187 n=1 Tax=Ceratina calcarata TaxID=156304 RepID=A0AAJ7NDW3_9HYME|nr:uncharacterized protein LOC108631187 [Ceratina calcarata]
MLTDRTVATVYGDARIEGLANRGCPQGGILSPTLWSLAVDSLLEKLRTEGTQVWGYADDIAIMVAHENTAEAKRQINRALKTVENWCEENGLSVNPSKTKLLIVTRRKRRMNTRGIKLNGIQLNRAESVKYLGITFTSNLSWKPQIKATLNRAKNNLATINRMVGSTWGLTPTASHWVYNSIILPRLTFGALIWWEGINNEKDQKRLESLQHTGLKRILSAFRYSPTRAMEAMLATPTLSHKIEETAIRTAKLLKDWNKWQPSNSGHASILERLVPETETNLNMTMEAPTDKVSLTFRFGKRFKTQIPGRKEWEKGKLKEYENWIKWYTDGSKNEEGDTGCAWITNDPNKGNNVYLGKHTTVYQAEAIAITRCAEEMIENETKNESIVIFTDSESTVKTMEKSSFKSIVALECYHRLTKLAKQNKNVVLCWCPGHRGIEGNEKADQLAKEAVELKRTGTESWTPISYARFKAELRSFTLSRLRERWSETTTCRQSRQMIKQIDTTRAKEILKMHRSDTRILTYILTGHAPLNYHLFRMGVKTNGECDCHTREMQTTKHILLL